MMAIRNSNCFAEVPPRLIDEIENSRKKIHSLYLKIRYDTESPYKILKYAKLTNHLRLKKGIEIVAFNPNLQLHRFNYEESQIAPKDKQGNRRIETSPEHEVLTATGEGLNKNIVLPGNIGIMYSKNFYPFENILNRSYYFRANAIYVDDPLASEEAKVNAKKTTLPEAFSLLNLKLEKENENEFVVSYTNEEYAVKIIYVISKKYGFRVKTIDYFNLPDLRPLSSYRCTDFRLLSDQVWLPFKAEYIQYHDGMISSRTFMKVLEVELNNDNVAKHAEFQFAPGTQVTDFSGVTPKQAEEIDRTNNISFLPEYTIAADGSIIDKQLKMVPKSSPKYIWAIILINVLLILGLMAYFLYKKKTK
ncbi:hypothetical protein [Gimesia maris]|nr:hypothetical protein [Gimesia maris]|tara:strand:- start:1694 stop:2779 length:1086 start_codon:yes stop_codon:yes gene_type:complete